MSDYEDNENHYQRSEDSKRGKQMDQDTLNMPIKNHLEKLDKQIEDLIKDLDDNKKFLNNLKNDVLNMGNVNGDQSGELQRFVMEEILRIAKDFRNLSVIEVDECTFLKQQVNQITQDRIRLQQNALVLESKVTESEKDIGLQTMYD